MLNVGQCGFDHAAISDFLQHIVSADVDAADTAADAEKLVRENRYALVLINRILDRDGSSGIDLINKLRQMPHCPPVMLVSNLPDAQVKAMAAGAVQGFGKATLGLPQTAEYLREILDATFKS
jgi:DNA-binding response OmpR family regulator